MLGYLQFSKPLVFVIILFEFVLGSIAIGSLLYISQQVEKTHGTPSLEVDMERSPIDIQDMVSDRARYLQADIEPPDFPDMTLQQTLKQQMELLRKDYENVNPAILSPGLKPDEIYVSDYRNYDYIERDD